MRWILCVALAGSLAVAGCWRQNEVARSYYESGKLKTEASMKNSVLEGHATMFFESGKKMGEADYKGGVLNGKALSYYETGAKKSAAEYKEGVLNGIANIKVQVLEPRCEEDSLVGPHAGVLQLVRRVCRKKCDPRKRRSDNRRRSRGRIKSRFELRATADRRCV